MAQQPNILFITSDQQHWNTLGCINPEIKTPCLDRLCAEGTRFDRAYCPNPTCTPTRASIITGQYPSQHGAYALGTKLLEDRLTIGELLMANNYDTALIGKAHFQPLRSTDEFRSLEAYPTLQDLDFWRKYEGPFYGFKHFELARNHTDEAHVGQHYAIWLEEKGCDNWRDYFQPPTGNTPAQRHKWNIPEELHYNTWITERTNARLEHYKESGEPFFLWASFFDPHPSYLVPEPWDRMYDPEKLTVPQATPGEHAKTPLPTQMTQTESPDYSPWQEPGGNGMHGYSSHLHNKEDLARDIATYYGMTSFLDQSVGRIVDKLDALGLAENTIVVFTSDHGHYYGHHGLIAKGGFHYEDGVRVPFIVRWPGKVPAAQTSDALQSLVDLPVSFLSLLGMDKPATMTGLNQADVWLGKQEQARDHVIVENRHQPTTIHMRTYIDQRFKITVYYNRDYGELYDMEADPGESNNLWDDPGSLTLKSALLLKLVHAELGKEPLPMPRIAGA